MSVSSRKGVTARRARGLTMIELMIAVTVALVLLAALAGMYGSSVKARNEIERTNRQIENGRYAIQLLRDEIQLAGFYGEYNMVDLGSDDLAWPPAALPDVCVTHLDALADLPADGVADTDGDGVLENIDDDLTGDNLLDGLDYLAAVMPLHVQGFNNVAAGTLPGCLSGADVKTGTDVIVVRRVMTCAAGDANCTFTASAPYFQASECDSQINLGSGGVPGQRFLLRADGNTSLFNRTDRTCVAANTTPVRRFLTRVYFVANNDVAGDGIPTLKRRDLVAGGWETTALVEGIEDLQFEYGVDAAGGCSPTAGDGEPDTYFDDPASDTVAASVQEAWCNVMSVRVHLLSRSTEIRAGYDDINSYVLGSKTIAAPRDAYTRKVFQTLVQLNNVAGRRE